MDSSRPAWITDCAREPIAFAQVREDALLDLSVLDQLGDDARVIMVASGGCTAAVLAASGKLSWLHLVDPNPAQIALSRLKLRLLQTVTVDQRLALLGHAPLHVHERRAALAQDLAALDLSPDILGSSGLWGNIGPDHAGRYELLFAQLRSVLAPVSAALTDVLRLRDPVEQAERLAPATRLGIALDHALDDVMELPNLVALFGEGATRNRVEPFARHFARRTRHALATLPAATNPYLWQMYSGTFPEGVVYPWLTLPAPPRMPELTWSISGMAQTLETRPEEFDLVLLSNILDWLSPEEARTTLCRAAAALRRGGLVFIRQLNSTLDIPACGEAFDWQATQANDLHCRDRSFFYRALHLGRKR